MPEWEKALPGPKSALEARRIVGIDGFGGKSRAAAGLRARQRDGGVATDWYRAGGDAAVRITHVAPRSSWGTFLVKATTEGSVWTSWASPCATRSRAFWASGCCDGGRAAATSWLEPGTSSS